MKKTLKKYHVTLKLMVNPSRDADSDTPETVGVVFTVDAESKAEAIRIATERDKSKASVWNSYADEAETIRPKVKVVGNDGNVFAIMGRCDAALKRAGLRTEAAEMMKRVFAAKSYNAALNIMQEYCDFN